MDDGEEEILDTVGWPCTCRGCDPEEGYRGYALVVLNPDRCKRQVQ